MDSHSVIIRMYPSYIMIRNMLCLHGTNGAGLYCCCMLLPFLPQCEHNLTTCPVLQKNCVACHHACLVCRLKLQKETCRVGLVHGTAIPEHKPTEHKVCCCLYTHRIDPHTKQAASIIYLCKAFCTTTTTLFDVATVCNPLQFLVLSSFGSKCADD